MSTRASRKKSPQLAAAESRFTKLGSRGEPLPPDATEWVAVRDAKAGLTWSRTLPCGAVTQREALKTAAALDLLGGAYWRLPTRAELLTLVDDTRDRPAIDTDFFPNCRSDWYWTSTAAASSPSGCAWVVSFYGGPLWYDLSVEGFVRAVRPGQ